MNPEAVVQYLVHWVRAKVEEAGALGIVLGISGGIDSAVAAVIAKKAFPDNCLALFLPCKSDMTDRIHSRQLAEEFSIPYKVIELDNAYHLLIAQFESCLKLEGPKRKLALANIKPRLRMLTLYYYAQANNYLVMGTSNKSELTVGYFTKYGDNAADFQPLGDLLKREVYKLARYLQIPDAIMKKPPSGGLWRGQTDEGEMGITYEQLDNYIALGEGDSETTAKIEKMIKVSEHKRKLPPVAVIPREYK